MIFQHFTKRRTNILILVVWDDFRFRCFPILVYGTRRPSVETANLFVVYAFKSGFDATGISLRRGDDSGQYESIFY